MFWEDYYRINPKETKRSRAGELVYENTGDPLIDKWEGEIALGLVPDLYEGLPPEKRRKSEASIEKLKQEKMDIERSLAAEGFSDDYRKIMP